MKKLAFSMIILSCEFFVKVKKEKLDLTRLNNYGLRYKVGSEKRFYRFTLLSLNGRISDYHIDSTNEISKSLGVGVNIGLEKRKSIADKFDIYYGSDLLASYRKTKTEFSDHTSENLCIVPGIGFVIGFRYKANNNINLSAELVPSISYSYTVQKDFRPDEPTTEQRTNSLLFDQNNNSASLTIGYSF